MYFVSLRVTDSRTGQATPCRLHIRDEAGRYYPPLGRSAEFPGHPNEDVGAGLRQSQKSYAVIDGACEISLPHGVPLHVEITKGLFFKPINKVVTLGAGQLTMRFELEAWDNAEQWVQADSRAHFLPPHDARLEGNAEGLDFVNLLALSRDMPSIDGKLYFCLSNINAFSGQREAFGATGGGVFVNTMNQHPALGRLSLLNCHRVVYPLTFGMLGESDDWSLGDWACQCHRKNGLVVWSDAYRNEAGLPGGEALIQAIYGRVDAFEIDGKSRQTPILPAWYRLLNAGVNLALIGGSAKDSNQLALGCVRTLTRRTTSELPTYGEWIEQIRRGESMVTNGPIIEWSINDKPASGSITLDQPGNVVIRATAKSPIPYEKLEIVVKGSVVASATPSSEDFVALESSIEISEGTWVAVRCRGTKAFPVYPQIPVFAHTSACMISIAGRPTKKDRAACSALREQIEAVRGWVESEGRFLEPKFQKEMLDDIKVALGKLEDE